MATCLPSVSMGQLVDPAAELAGAAQGTGQWQSLTGVLEILWGDPLPLGSAAPQVRYFLFGDEGEEWELRMDPAQFQAAGGVRGLNRQRVAVSGVVTRADANVLTVEEIGLERAADFDDGARFRAAGSQPYVWILVRFGDDPSTPEQPSWFQTQALGPWPSLDHFWREVSFNQIDLLGSQIAGWYTLPQPRSYYVYDVNPEEPGDELDWGRCVDDATALADPDVFFPDFIGVNICFNGVLDGAAWGGSWTINRDGVSRGYGVTWMPGANLGWYTQGILAHEMGHALSLPHSSGPYGQTYDSQWDVMSAATGTCAQWHSVYGCLGTHTIAYHKNWLGWIPASRRYLVGSAPEVTTLTLYDLATEPPAGYGHYVRIPSGADSFYTIERRRWTGYDQNVPAGAVVLHRVDYALDDHARVVDPDGNGDCNDAGAQWTPGETFHDSAAGVLVSVDLADDYRSLVTFTNAPRTSVYVDFANSGYEDGSVASPWNTLREGYGAVVPEGGVYLAPGSYSGTTWLMKPARLERNGSAGVVIIGS